MVEAQGQARTSVVIVEDHAMIRDMMAKGLRESGFDVLGVAGTAAEGFAIWSAQRPEILLCDITLEGPVSGIDLTRMVIAEDPQARVVMVSAENEGHTVEEAYEAGAVGYVAKRATLPELVETITDAVAGIQRAADRHTYRQLLSALRAPKPKQPRQPAAAPFTAREREVLGLMASGTTSTAQIAAKLGVSASTVRTYVDGCLRKLDVHSRAEAVARAYQLGLIEK